MKEELIEYHPSGRIKHNICYYDNGCKYSERFYDEDGQDHRENGLPDYQGWYKNGILRRKTYCQHGWTHNINDPADICLHENGKIRWKNYWTNDVKRTKLNWMNKIKNI